MSANWRGYAVDVTRDETGARLFDEEKEAALGRSFYELVCMMRRLRRGCPWDKEQTPASLKRYVLEEAYEVLETIELEDWNALREELGDFVFQVAFQAEIQDEAGRFDFEDVLTDLVSKMVRRHPHVFSDGEARTAADVNRTWETLKQKEKGPKTSIYDGLTRGLPALLESHKIARKAAKLGFDWENTDQVEAKIREELAELHEAASPEEVQEELGDLLFAVSNLVRKHGFEPEETLRMANRKFVKRFRGMEHLARDRGEDLEALDLAAQEALWQAVKRNEGR